MGNFWQAVDASSMETWRIDGPNGLIKVIAATRERDVLTSRQLSGYFTQQKYLYGKTLPQIERMLGLRPRELGTLAHVYGFARLPKFGEFRFRLSAAMPDGKQWQDADFAQFLQARADYAEGRNLYQRSANPTVQAYPPGAAGLPQWQLVVPVPLGKRIGSVTEVFAFPRDNGSLQEYRPYNRAPVPF